MTSTLPDIAVELWTARIPYIGRLAEHHWLLVCRPDRTDRWEVWQRRNQCEDAWGYLHLNLLPPSSGVGNGQGWQLKRWLGSEAAELAERVETAPANYPWCGKYCVFPGPNSNTFVQWVIGSRYILGWRGVGHRFALRSKTADNSCC